jgi:hypothetical protein
MPLRIGTARSKKRGVFQRNLILRAGPGQALRSNASSSASRSPAGVNTRPFVSVFRITAVSVVGEVVDVIARSLRHLRLFQIEGLGVTLTVKAFRAADDRRRKGLKRELQLCAD